MFKTYTPPLTWLTKFSMGWFNLRWYRIRAITFAYMQKFFALLCFLPVPPKMSAAAIIEREGNFLVVNLSYRNGYGFPGGLAEPDENLEETLSREVKEETGLDVTRATYVGSANDYQYGLSVVVAGFLVETTGNEKESIEGSLHWLPAQTILENCAYNNSRKVFVQYLKSINHASVSS